MKAYWLLLVTCVSHLEVSLADKICSKKCLCKSENIQNARSQLLKECPSECLCSSRRSTTVRVNKCPKSCKCNSVEKGTEVVCVNGNIDEKSDMIPRLPKDTVSLEYGNAYLAYVSRKTFKRLERLKLRSLKLYNNHIQNMSDDAFLGLPRLSFLEISEERLVGKDVISTALHTLSRRVKMIRMSANFWDVPPNLNGLQTTRIKEIDFTLNNFRTFSGNWFLGIRSLKTVRVMINSINENNYNFTGIEQVEYLYVGNNLFEKFPDFCRHRFTNLRTFDIKNNKLLYLKQSDFRCLLTLTHLILDGNPIIMLFRNMFAALPSLQVLSVSYLRNDLYRIDDTAFNSTSLKSLKLVENGIIFAHRYVETLNVFRLCRNIEVLDISYNIIDGARILSLLYPLKRLTTLYMKNMGITILPEMFLPNLPKLLILDLSENALQGLWNGKFVFGNETRLKELYLSKNEITSVRPTAFPEYFLNNLTRLDLSKNTFSCACDDIKWFFNWMQNNRKILGQTINQITCTRPFEGKAIINLTENELCPIDIIYIIVISVFGGALVLIFASLLVLYKMRWHIRYLLYKMKLRKKGYERLANDPEFQYDIFLNFADEDRHFVLETMVPYFENYGYRLCIRYRDFEIGKFQVDNIVENLNLSRLVLLVLSNNFARSPWCEFQLEVAYNRCLEEKRNNVIVTVLEDISYKYLTNTLRVLLTSQEYAVWSKDETGRRLFWEKVLFKISLPENACAPRNFLSYI